MSIASSGSDSPTLTLHRRTNRRLCTATRESLTLGDPTLLRGTRASKLLRRCGRLLRDSEGSAETYKMSEQVEQIDAFISHNWSTSPVQKWMVLAVYFNFCLASSVALVVMAACFVLTSLGVLPCIRFDHKGMIMGESGAFSLFVGSAALFLALFFGRGLAAALGLSGPMVFLDKTCIHQTDQELKMKGIKSLPAQLIRSKSVVVVYTETYLRKVWTVYELASALTLHPHVTLVVLPLFFPRLVMLGALVYPIRFGALLLLKTNATGSWGSYISRYCFDLALLPMYLLFAVVLRSWAKERLRIKRTVRDFDIRSATCAFESDRALVKDNVVCFMRDFEYVSENSSTEEALAAFNALVRRKVPRALMASFGITGIPHLFLLAAFVLSVGRCLDALGSGLHQRQRFAQIFHQTWDLLTLYASLFPNSLAIMSWTLSRRTELGGLREVLLVTLAALGTVLFNVAGKRALLHLSRRAGTLRDWQTYAFALVIIVSFVMTYALYFPRGSKLMVPKGSCIRYCRSCCQPRRASLDAQNQAGAVANTSSSDEGEHDEDDAAHSLSESDESTTS